LFALLQVLTHPLSHLRIVLEPSNLALEQFDRLILNCMLVAQARHIDLSGYVDRPTHHFVPSIACLSSIMRGLKPGFQDGLGAGHLDLLLEPPAKKLEEIVTPSETLHNASDATMTRYPRSTASRTAARTHTSVSPPVITIEFILRS
jgi:hypothetical protein